MLSGRELESNSRARASFSRISYWCGQNFCSYGLKYQEIANPYSKFSFFINFFVLPFRLMILNRKGIPWYNGIDSFDAVSLQSCNWSWTQSFFGYRIISMSIHVSRFSSLPIYPVELELHELHIVLFLITQKASFIKMDDICRPIVIETRWQISSSRHVPWYVYDSASNVSHFLTVNNGVQIWINEC